MALIILDALHSRKQLPADKIKDILRDNGLHVEWVKIIE